MEYSLKQIADALDNIQVADGDKNAAIEKLNNARQIMAEAVCEMDNLTVCGRKTLDTLLGCMMLVEAIIGKDDDNG